MANGNITPSRLGASMGATGTYDQDNALFLKVFGNEVLAAFEEAIVMKETKHFKLASVL